MRKKHLFCRVVSLILLAVFCAALAVPATAAYPRAVDLVADDAEALTAETISGIRKINKTLAADVDCQIAVCVVGTTGAVEIGEYARGVFVNWKLGEGILLLIAVDDKSYYMLPSTGVENVLTNEVLSTIRDETLETEFSLGNTDGAVAACVNRLAATLTAGMPAVTVNEPEPTTAEEEDSSPVWSFIKGLFKVILWAVIIAVLIFVILFVIALFNDNVAEFLRRNVFSKLNGRNKRKPTYDYDERLYGKAESDQRVVRRSGGSSAGRRPYGR